MGEIKRIDDLTTFRRVINEMVAKSDRSWNDSLGFSLHSRRIKEYTKEEVEQIINSSSLQRQ